MRNFALLLALSVWAVIVAAGGILLTEVQFASRNEAIVVAAVYLLLCLAVAGFISVIPLTGFSSATLTMLQKPFTRHVGPWGINRFKQRSTTNGVIFALVLGVAALSVLAYRMDQRIQELEGRPDPRTFDDGDAQRISDLERRVEQIPILPFRP